METENKNRSKAADKLVDAAMWLRVNGDRSGAEALLEQALVVDPEHERAHHIIASLKNTGSHPTQTQLVARGPDSPWTHNADAARTVLPESLLRAPPPLPTSGAVSARGTIAQATTRGTPSDALAAPAPASITPRKSTPLPVRIEFFAPQTRRKPRPATLHESSPNLGRWGRDPQAPPEVLAPIGAHSEAQAPRAAASDSRLDERPVDFVDLTRVSQDLGFVALDLPATKVAAPADVDAFKKQVPRSSRSRAALGLVGLLAVACGTALGFYFVEDAKLLRTGSLNAAAAEPPPQVSALATRPAVLNATEPAQPSPVTRKPAAEAPGVLSPATGGSGAPEGPADEVTSEASAAAANVAASPSPASTEEAAAAVARLLGTEQPPPASDPTPAPLEVAPLPKRSPAVAAPKLRAPSRPRPLPAAPVTPAAQPVTRDGLLDPYAN